MSSILKENENSVLTAAPSATAGAVPVAPVAKSSVEEPARPQPVALEIAVTVNGARTVEGSDKREPFSETTKTVLVFGQGAVVRISSALAPGQLIFLTNEKTKKEVVCQVVKSKSQGAANGYVELRFTEPAPGYWGMRFPAGNTAPAASVAPRPAAPASSKPVAATPAVIAPVTPAVLPAVTISVAPAVPAEVTPVAPPKSVVAPVEQKKETVAAMVAESPRAEEAAPVIEAAKIAETQSPSAEKIAQAKPEVITSSSEEKIAVPEAVPSIPKIAIADNPSLDDLAKQLTKELLQGSLKEPAKEAAQGLVVESANKSDAEPVVEEAAKMPANVLPPAATLVPAVVPAQTSSDELKQKAAQLQQQLGSLLFADSKQPPAVSPVPEAASSGASQKVVEIAKAETAASGQPVISQPAATPQKPVMQSIEAEEVKIPSWLAPLARESDFRTVDTTNSAATTIAAVGDSGANNEAEVSPALEDAPNRQESPMFGGQLITDSPAAGESAGGSKKGLWMGIAAGALLLVGGGAWYAKQPDSLLAGIFSSNPAPAQKSAPAGKNPSQETPFRNEVSQPANSSRASSTASNIPASNSNIATPIPNTSSTNSTAAVSFPSAKNSVAGPSSAAPKAESLEQPRKPVFGDMHLTTPSIKRADGSTDSNSAEPTIENNSSATGADSLNSLGVGNHGGPAIPLPVGGEVKQAKLLKAVPPTYPPAAKAQHVSGDVKLDALIDTHGKVTATKVLSGPGLLHQAAADAVKQWQYEPAQLNGQSTSMHLTVTVQFRLQ